MQKRSAKEPTQSLLPVETALEENKHLHLAHLPIVRFVVLLQKALHLLIARRSARVHPLQSATQVLLDL